MAIHKSSPANENSAKQARGPESEEFTDVGMRIAERTFLPYLSGKDRGAEGAPRYSNLGLEGDVFRGVCRVPRVFWARGAGV
jgi:hypothetical protein